MTYEGGAPTNRLRSVISKALVDLPRQVVVALIVLALLGIGRLSMSAIVNSTNRMFSGYIDYLYTSAVARPEDQILEILLNAIFVSLMWILMFSVRAIFEQHRSFNETRLKIERLDSEMKGGGSDSPLTAEEHLEKAKSLFKKLDTWDFKIVRNIRWPGVVFILFFWALGTLYVYGVGSSLSIRDTFENHEMALLPHISDTEDRTLKGRWAVVSGKSSYDSLMADMKRLARERHVSNYPT